MTRPLDRARCSGIAYSAHPQRENFRILFMSSFPYFISIRFQQSLRVNNLLPYCIWIALRGSGRNFEG
jgi:hypothetical protein